MPSTSAVRATGSTSSTPLNADTSSPGVCAPSRTRKRFDVFLASRTGEPGGMAAYWRWSRSRAATKSEYVTAR